MAVGPVVAPALHALDGAGADPLQIHIRCGQRVQLRLLVRRFVHQQRLDRLDLRQPAAQAGRIKMSIKCWMIAKYVRRRQGILLVHSFINQQCLDRLDLRQPAAATRRFAMLMDVVSVNIVHDQTIETTTGMRLRRFQIEATSIAPVQAVVQSSLRKEPITMRQFRQKPQG